VRRQSRILGSAYPSKSDNSLYTAAYFSSIACYFLRAAFNRRRLLTRAQNQPQTQPQPTPSPTPAPSPSPSPTPPPNLHQWGAVTSFHGLPSDRTHAIAQTDFGVTWFATDGGLARYDGRRTNAINAEGLPPGRVLALKTDASGALWIGTKMAPLAAGTENSIQCPRLRQGYHRHHYAAG
jgi:hypothetical protein